MSEFKFIDLFCGIGGFHQAMSSLGGECVFACDIDEHCQKTYYKNYGIMPVGDITKVDPADIPEHDVLCGGFPCQAFSIAGKRLGFADPTKGTLFFDIMRIVKHHHPKYMLLENVRNLAGHDGGNTWKVIHQELCDAGYNVSPEPVIFSPHYIGIPQHRERVFIMCVRQDIGDLPEFYFDRKQAAPCTIDTVLQDDSEIPHIHKYRMKKGDIELLDMWNEFLHGVRPHIKKLPLFPVTDLFLHSSVEDIPTFNQLTIPKAIVALKNITLYNSAPEFITDWIQRANKLAKYKGAKRMLEWHAGNPSNPDIWDTVIQFRQSGVRTREPHHFPTLTAVIQTPIIGKRKRTLTPRECARLQSFPDTFQYDEREREAYKQFGNSVNVEVVKLFARFLLGDAEMHERFRRPTPEELEALYGPKRKRGRPRKYPLPEDGGEDKPKRKRGRPKKYDLEFLAGNLPPAPRHGRPKKEKPIPVDEFGNPLPKRGRGRPRKVYIIDGVEVLGRPKRGRPKKEPKPPLLGPDGNPLPKRGRGRPRKNPQEPQGELSAAPKRHRGRPRKDPSTYDTPPQPRRKRGRPRKNPQ